MVRHLDGQKLIVYQVGGAFPTFTFDDRRTKLIHLRFVFRIRNGAIEHVQLVRLLLYFLGFNAEY